MKKLLGLLTILPVLVLSGFNHLSLQSSINGAWRAQVGNVEHVIIFQDNYFTLSSFDKEGKKFIKTKGGSYTTHGNHLHALLEYNTANPGIIGHPMDYTFSINDQTLMLNMEEDPGAWTRIDNGSGALAGNWRITGRMRNDTMSEIKRSPRKTLKILSGTRFQWMAINTETKEFFGTGGGTYQFINGKYTENIEFFSRDSTRVGASLSFDGQVSGNVWTHKGLSSRGEPIHEEWSREK